MNKKIILFIGLGILLLVGLYASFTVAVRTVESKAKQESNGDFSKELQILKEKQDEKIWLGCSYKFCKKIEFPIGKIEMGGADIMIKIDAAGIIETMTQNCRDSLFLIALQKAKMAETGSFEEMLVSEYEKLNSNGKLAIFFLVDNRFKPSMSNKDVASILKDELEKTRLRTIAVISERFKKNKIDSEIVSSGTDMIRIMYRGEHEKERVKRMITSSGSLKFYETFENNYEIFERFNSINQFLAQMELNTDSLIDSTKILNPLFEKLSPAIENDTYGNQILSEGSIVGYTKIWDTAQVNQYLLVARKNNLLLNGLSFLWGYKMVENSFLPLYAIKSKNGLPVLDGESIENAKAKEEYDNLVIELTMTSNGVVKWAEITSNNIGKYIAIVINEKVYSAPQVVNKITQGQCNISGNFTKEEQVELIQIINAGTLPTSVNIISWYQTN